jgi:hypothetical protein
MLTGYSRLVRARPLHTASDFPDVLAKDFIYRLRGLENDRYIRIENYDVGTFRLKE